MDTSICLFVPLSIRLQFDTKPFYLDNMLKYVLCVTVCVHVRVCVCVCVRVCVCVWTDRTGTSLTDG